MRVVKFIVGGLFIFTALGMFAQKEIVAGLFAGILGAVILPPVSDRLKEKFKFWQNKGVRYVGYFVLLVLMGVSSKKGNFGQNVAKTEQKSEVEATENPYQRYIDESKVNIANLTPANKASREKIYAELKANPVYNELVTQKIVSTEYLPVLNALTNAVTGITDTQYTIDEVYSQQVESLPNGSKKMEFVVKCGALAMPTVNGGLPQEILEVFDRYKTKYGTSGVKGTAYDANKNAQEIKYDYDLTPFFAMLNPSSKEDLRAVFEAKKKGLSKWFEKGKYVYPYIATKEGFMEKYKQIDPDSDLFPKIDMEVSAQQLYSDYEANEVSADQKYKGKRLLITGTVGNIGKDITDSPYVSLEIDYLKNVNCYFDDKNNNVLSQLEKGQKVQIIGTCGGLMLTDVMMKDCELWE